MSLPGFIKDNIPLNRQEESTLLHLCCMFERIDCSTILEVIRKRKCDMDSCIDDLLIINPEPTPLKTDVESVTVDQSPILDKENDLQDSLQWNGVEWCGMVWNGVEWVQEPILEATKIDVTPPEDNLKLVELESNPSATILPTKPRSAELDNISFVPTQLEDKPSSAPPSPRADQDRKFATKTKLEEKRRISKLKQVRKPKKKSKARDLEDVLPILPVDFHSVGVDKETQLLQKISDLQSITERVEDEKKNAMKWCVDQMQQMREEIKTKDEKSQQAELAVQQREEEIQRLKGVIEQQQTQQTKLQQLLTTSKEVIVEGVQTLGRNVAKVTEKGWNKVQVEFRKEDKEWVVLEKMKEFALNLKQEINTLLTRDRVAQRECQAEEQQIKEQEQITLAAYKQEEECKSKEEEEVEKAKQASLKSYAQEYSIKQD